MDLETGEKYILSAIVEAEKNHGLAISDQYISESSSMDIVAMRSWLEVLEKRGFIERVRRIDDFAVSITARGRLALNQSMPVLSVSDDVPMSSAAYEVIGAINLPKTTSSPRPKRIVVLVLTSNPLDTDRLRLDLEVKRIEQSFQRSKRRRHFRVVAKGAVTKSDIIDYLFEYQPNILHFSGHGSPEGIIVEDEAGNSQLIHGQSLASLFGAFSEKLTCVVLNTINSAECVSIISQSVKYVIGMNGAITDSSAIEFSVGFYSALASGYSIDDAHKLGCSAISLESLSEENVPVIRGGLVGVHKASDVPVGQK
jgi:DNA-binding MarR family transcriptional regulator